MDQKSGELVISLRSDPGCLTHMASPPRIGRAEDSRMVWFKLDMVCRMTGARMNEKSCGSQLKVLLLYGEDLLG
jgi:hypothetical protein